MGWDLDVLRQLAAHRTGWADASTRVLMAVGMSPLAYGAALVLCLLFGWRFRAWGVAVAALASSVLCLALATVGKHLVGRPRPSAALALVHPGGYSMLSSVAAM